MPTSEFAFRVFLILLPGFAAAYLVQALTVRAKQTDLEKIIEAFLFSFMIYISYYFCRPGQLSFISWSAGGQKGIALHRGDLLLLLTVTLGYALASFYS